MSYRKKKHYDVGYKKPPKHSQFPSGQSGNKKGRPPGSTRKSIAEKLDKELERKIQIQENGKSLKVTKLEAYFKRIINGAINNEGRCVNALAKILPLVEAYREKVADTDHDYRPVVIIHDDIPCWGAAAEIIAKRKLWEMIQECKKLGTLPDMEEPPDFREELKKAHQKEDELRNRYRD